MDSKTLENTKAPHGSAALLRNGKTFKESLRDGRTVWANGRRVEDVTTHPTLGPGINLIAEYFDDQFDPKYEDILTFVDSNGERVSRSWQVPLTHEDLVVRRRLNEYTTLKTAGTFGRPPRGPFNVLCPKLVCIPTFLTGHEENHKCRSSSNKVPLVQSGTVFLVTKDR
jgi:4-hydroxyphenylacetate 3-monooxygenase